MDVAVVTAKYPYSYKNNNGDSLQMKPGDVFQLIKKSNKDWWYVRKVGEKPVYLPATYLQERDPKPASMPTPTPASVPAPATVQAPTGNGERRGMGSRHGNHNSILQEMNERFTAKPATPPNIDYEERKEGRKRPTELDVIIPSPLDSRDRVPSPYSETSSPLYTPSRENSWNSAGDGGVVKNPAVSPSWARRLPSENSYPQSSYDVPQTGPRGPQMSHLGTGTGGSTPHSPTTVVPPQEEQNVPGGWRVERTVTRDPVFINEVTSEKWYKATPTDGEPYYYSEDRSQTRWELPTNPSPTLNNQRISVYSTSPVPDMAVREKEGLLTMMLMKDRGRQRKVRPGYAVLAGSQLKYYKDLKHYERDSSNPEVSLNLWKAEVNWTRTKAPAKRLVFELTTDQGIYLVQGDDEVTSQSWFEAIKGAVMGVTRTSEESSPDEKSRDDALSPLLPSPGLNNEVHKKSNSGISRMLKNFLTKRPVPEDLKRKGILQEENVFGKDIRKLCERERTTVPNFVNQCIKYIDKKGLECDGIYRVSGNLSLIQKLRFQVDQEKPVDLETSPWKEDIHVITGALKLYFRELPEPLFTFKTFDKFIASINQIPGAEQKILAFRALFSEMPRVNQDTIFTLFSHLKRVMDNVQHNRMPAKNLATVFGPTLMWPERESMNISMATVYQNQVMEFVLLEFDNIFQS